MPSQPSQSSQPSQPSQPSTPPTSPAASLAGENPVNLTVEAKVGVGVGAPVGALLLILLLSFAAIRHRRRKEDERKKLAGSTDPPSWQRKELDGQPKVKLTHELQANYLAQERAELRGEAGEELDDWRNRPELPGDYKFPKRSKKTRVRSI